MTTRAELLASLDRRGAKVQWVALERGGWKVIVDGVESAPFQGIARDGWTALASVLGVPTSKEVA